MLLYPLLLFVCAAVAEGEKTPKFAKQTTKIARQKTHLLTFCTKLEYFLVQKIIRIICQIPYFRIACDGNH